MKKRFKQHHQNIPSLRFSPTAWAKLVFLRDMSHNEVAGFGITDAEDLMFIRDIVIIKQRVSIVSFLFDDNAVADFFADQVDAGRKPEQFARILIHTHPGNSSRPSTKDDETFKRVFGACDWSVMVIIAQDDSSYALLRFNAGPGGEIEIPICVDYACEFESADHKQWKTDYRTHVKEDRGLSKASKNTEQPDFEAFGYDQTQEMALLSSDDLLEHLEHMHPSERQYFMDELAISSEFWDEEMEVLYE